ncbi:major head protein [Enterococcus phage AE4_17]|uniref:Capsid and scaffold protein n=1 Tax=Enterococcus phage AE4_17 TaxID=2759198 RepID=A0A7L7SKK7_9CAUD|nr:major head protein [Enterococcus phage AE4_17]QNR52537.1 capsid and scaffold protein [Enterococcus phage ZEF1]QOC55081.1 capsid and scaffold protein [Enterococcus phage AE4_17]
MATTKAAAANLLAGDVKASLENFNHEFGEAWTLGQNWTSVGTQFETFINKFLFPKLNETRLIQVALGNSFDWLAQEVDFVGQYSEEYVIKDTIPTNMDLSKDELLMLKRNYPDMITKLYGPGIVRKVKFTLNNNDVRQNWLTLKDGVKYAIAVYKKKISDINVDEERQIKGMLVDYAENQLDKDAQVFEVADMEEMFKKIAVEMMNLQTNQDKYNEANKASGGTIGRYTTVSDMSKLMILTTTEIKARLLDSKLANTYHINGIDFSDRIIAFPELGGVFRAKADIPVTEAVVTALKALGDYQVTTNSTIPKDAVVTFDVTKYLPSVADQFEEIKPSNDLWAMILDVDSIVYNRFTKGMLKAPFYNPEFDEVTYWIHYYSMKAISPFYNKVLVKGKTEPTEPEVTP